MDERTGEHAKYSDILAAVIEINGELKGINRHLARLNNKTAKHSGCIEVLEKWVSAHDAVQDVLDQARRDRTKNNITLLGVIAMILFNIYQHFIA